MKIKNILLAGLFLFGLSACNDFLDVEPPSKFESEYVFGSKEEINRALNGVYAQLLNEDVYGNKYMATFCLNSDVDMSTYTNELSISTGYRRFDCNSTGSDINSFWTAAYKGVEHSNNFIYSLEQSEIYDTEDAEIMQMLGEAKVIRAMFYHDLVVMFGDVPFSFIPTYEAEQSGYEDKEASKFLLPVINREEIHKALINDLKSIAPYMSFAGDLADGVERVSKEFCWSMIARMALTCGGYSLRPNISNPSSYGTMERPSNYKEYYEITRQYCDSVISSGTHNLNLAYNKVFINQCNYIVNNNDDPIFEIPFAKNSTGSVGYLQGPTGENYEGKTSGKNIWGKSNGGSRFSAFYRFSFDEDDCRRDFLNGLWYYLYDGEPNMRNDYTVHNNKWSKFWQTTDKAMGVASDDNTGINYPYMRYTDVLLMYAEVVNELENGISGGANGAKAIDAFRKVRSRAFTNAEKVDAYIASVSGSKESFLKAILDERKWEFGGENMRWRDLVRNNLYSEVIYYSFMRYYGLAQARAGSYEYIDMVGEYDGDTEYLNNLPFQMYHQIISNPGDINIYPNTTLDIREILNPYAMYVGSYPTGYDVTNYYEWWNETDGCPKDQCLFSFYGYIRADRKGSVLLVDDNGKTVSVASGYPTNLPPVRYILPYPNAAIQRSAGVYKNYYGYN